MPAAAPFDEAQPEPPTGGAAEERCDLAVVGAGAAGLFAAIWAGRRAAELGTPLRIVALDGAKKLGAKILVAGGGRCNVTHHAVDETAYAGSTRNAIRQVLRAFPVERTTGFFADLGVRLKREETGKLFPTTDSAHTVLDALLAAARDAGVELRHPWRVGGVERVAGGFLVRGPGGAGLHARRVVLCTGGMALPRTGSDGAGYGFSRALGHTVTPLVFPALVPLVLEEGHWITTLSGTTLEAEVIAQTAGGRRISGFTNSTLCTHFGLSGPSVLDASRHFSAERLAAGSARLAVCWTPGRGVEEIDAMLAEAQRRGERRSGPRFVAEELGLPARFAEALCAASGLPPSSAVHTLTKHQRRALSTNAAAMPGPVVRDRGFTHAEVTAGGVPLAELVLRTMASRVCPGLHLAGEVLDVDGRIGGFNFQWAWASGYLAGRGAAESAAGPAAGTVTP